MKWNDRLHRRSGEVFLHERNRRAGSLANSLSPCSLRIFVSGDSLMFWYLCWGMSSGKDEVVSCWRGWSSHCFYCRFPPWPWASHFSLLPLGCAHGESLVAPLYNDFCSFEDKTEHPRESGEVDVTAYIRCCKNTRLVPSAALTAAWCLASRQR